MTKGRINPETQCNQSYRKFDVTDDPTNGYDEKVTQCPNCKRWMRMRRVKAIGPKTFATMPRHSTERKLP